MHLLIYYSKNWCFKRDKMMIKSNLQDTLYQNKQLADAQTKIDIQSGKLLGANGYYGILPTEDSIISLRFGIEDNNITPQIVGNLGAGETIGLYYAIKQSDGTFIIGSPVTSNGRLVKLTSDQNYMNINLSGQYFLLKSITNDPVGIVLVDSNPMYNMCNGLY